MIAMAWVTFGFFVVFCLLASLIRVAEKNLLDGQFIVLWLIPTFLVGLVTLILGLITAGLYFFRG